MNAPPNPTAPIRDRVGNVPEGPEQFLWGATASVCLGHLLTGTSLGGRAAELTHRSVLIAARDQFAAALALIELDGIARRLIICPPDIARAHLAALAVDAEGDAIVSDHDGLGDMLDVPLRVACAGTVSAGADTPPARCHTDWVLL